MNGHLGDRAAAYVDGALDPAESARAAQHLAACPACRDKVAEQQRIRDLLRGTATAVRWRRGVRLADFLAALAAMPVAGTPPRPPAVAGGPSRTESVRWGAVAGVAAGATVLVTAWGVGGPVVAAGPPAVQPDRLLAQHTATAGALPFWGSGQSSWSDSSASKAAPVSGEPVAASLLRRGATASSAVTFRGVELVTTSSPAGSQTRVAEVSHIAQRGTSTRVVGTGGASDTSVFRPQSATETASGLDAVGLLASAYVLVTEGTDRVAGRDADRVAVYTHQGSLVARFWLDRASGLPLAREVRDADGAATEASAFTFVSVDDPEDMPGHLPVVASGASWVEAAGGTSPASLAALGDQGWVCPEALSAATGLKAFDVRLAEEAGGPVLHLVYTDGLRSVSVFQQRAALSSRALTGFVQADVDGHRVYRRDGVPGEVVWSSGPLVFTVVGDADPEVVESVVRELPHDPVDEGSRTGRGLLRVGSWLDPFG